MAPRQFLGVEVTSKRRQFLPNSNYLVDLQGVQKGHKLEVAQQQTAVSKRQFPANLPGPNESVEGEAVPFAP